MHDLRTLVVDDEPLARRRLKSLIERCRGAQWIGEAGTGHRALELIRSMAPDVVFLDIEMPGLSGIQVVERLRHPVQVVFTTAYDAYAVAAFELHAADYLLKPFGQARLQAAIDRAKSLSAGPGSAGVQRLFVRERGRILPLATERIVRLEADGDYVRVYAEGRVHLVTGTLTELHGRLDGDRFRRVHRSHVVNLDYAVAFESLGGGRLGARLQDGTLIPASRSRSRELRGLTA